MTHPLQTTIAQLPALLERNAPRMMTRMVARMQALIHDGPPGEDLTHGLLFLRVSEQDLVREFTAAVAAAFSQAEPDAFAGLSLEPESGRDTLAEFASSDAAFSKLCATAGGLGVRGMEAYGKGKFVTAMNESFVRARMDDRATHELLHYAKVALDGELAALYSQLERMGTQGA